MPRRGGDGRDLRREGDGLATPRRQIPGEVVVVDNGSTDRSIEIATAAGARVIHERRRGYGQAYLRGFAEARGDYIVMGDSDDTYDFLGPRCARRAAQTAEPTWSLGNRFAGGIANRRHALGPSLHRQSDHQCSSSSSSSARNIGDSQSGLRAFRSRSDRPARPAVERHGAGVGDDRQRGPLRHDHRRGARSRTPSVAARAS